MKSMALFFLEFLSSFHSVFCLTVAIVSFLFCSFVSLFVSFGVSSSFH